MAFPWWWLAVFAAIVVGIFIFALLLKGINYAIALALNSVIGFFALYAVTVFVPYFNDFVINIWSVVIIALFGLLGFVAVLALHGLGILF
jgi:hypothetical protein